MLITYRVTRTGDTLGECVARQLNDMRTVNHPGKTVEVVAVVPIITTFFAMGPERYETTSVDLIVEVF